jgi:acyl-coenzyme A thioesterase PaaI-like protein
MSPDPEEPIYPPAHHLLRDLRIVVEGEAKESAGRLEVVPALADAGGRPRVGVLATLVDVVASQVAIRSVLPGWTATSNLSLDLGDLPTEGVIEAIPRILRSGRQTVVVEVVLRSATDAKQLGVTTVGFSILRARNDVQKGGHWAEVPEARTEFALADRFLEKPILEAVGLEFDSADPAVARMAVRPYLLNSLGALQGGAVAILLEAAAEDFAGASLEGALQVRSLAVHYLKLARVGPVRAQSRVIARSRGGLLVRIELFDEGAGEVLLAVATIQVDEASGRA